MKPIILQQLNNFGYHYHEVSKEQSHGFLCHNSQSQDEFYLLYLSISELLKKGLKTIESLQQSLSKYVVVILEVDHQINEIIEILSESEEKPNISYLLYDPEEDIEFFMKDLWSVLVLVHHNAPLSQSETVI
jgi:phosphomannomutase